MIVTIKKSKDGQWIVPEITQDLIKESTPPEKVVTNSPLLTEDPLKLLCKECATLVTETELDAILN